MCIIVTDLGTRSQFYLIFTLYDFPWLQNSAPLWKVTFSYRGLWGYVVASSASVHFTPQLNDICGFIFQWENWDIFLSYRNGLLLLQLQLLCHNYPKLFWIQCPILGSATFKKKCFCCKWYVIQKVCKHIFTTSKIREHNWKYPMKSLSLLFANMVWHFSIWSTVCLLSEVNIYNKRVIITFGFIPLCGG